MTEEGETLVKRLSSVPPAAKRSLIPPRVEADTMRAAVEAALAPVRDRMDELERGMLEAIVRVAKGPASTNRTPIAPTAEAQDVLRALVEEALAPVCDRMDELERGMRGRRSIVVVMCGIILVNVATLVGVLTH
jgi:hypothetical protein